MQTVRVVGGARAACGRANSLAYASSGSKVRIEFVGKLHVSQDT